MQFHNPEVLFALFLLIIPVIVHLFQLRKFKTEKFTNVKFLRRITRQTRKSSRLKKLLVLTTRLLLLSCIIFAFARPYIPEENEVTGSPETIIYLDNSFSMQAEGQRGILLERSKQELLEQLPEDHVITLITNVDEYKGATRQDIQDVELSPLPVDLGSVILRARSLFTGDENSQKKLFLISDFQKEFQFTQGIEELNFQTYALPVRPQNLNNVSIDTAYFSNRSQASGTLNVVLSFSGENPGNVPVSLYESDYLLGKTSVEFNGSTQAIEFPVSEEKIEEGRLQIEDNGLQFDNVLYFSLNPDRPINVTAINSADGSFLNRIYTEPEFKFTSMQGDRIDYNILSNSQVVVLNEVEDLSGALYTTLLSLVDENVIVILIPPSTPGSGLLEFLQNTGFSGSLVKQENEKLITGISFNHPLYEGVFEGRVTNFEYPKVQNSFSINQGNGILNFEDNTPFLINSGENYLFTAPLNSNNSNFTQSPLIVPTFYNIGLTALRIPRLYYDLGKINKFDVATKLGSDKILEIGSPGETFIPLQQSFANKVEITIDELPRVAGNFRIFNQDEKITAVSFNIDRLQSRMEYYDVSEISEVTVVNDLNEFFTAAGYKKEVDTLWKWFVTFALIFLMVETLLLKYFK